MNIQMMPALKAEFKKFQTPFEKIFAFRPNNETLSELRKGDILIIAEYVLEEDIYTGSAIVRQITHIDYSEDLNNYIGVLPLKGDYVVFSFKKVPAETGSRFIDHFCKHKEAVYENVEDEEIVS